jgi:hypothetical protein
MTTHNEKMLLWSPIPTEVTPPEIATRIAVATVDVRDVAAAIDAFVDRYRGLFASLWTAVEAACPRGVPDDYMHPVEQANGWSTFEAALRDAVHRLDAVMPAQWSDRR